MAPDHSPDNFSFQDFVFLGIERPNMPLHIGAVSIFDGKIPLDRLRKHIAAKLGTIPRYTQKVEQSPLKLAHPRWIPDDHFDIRHHVHELKLGTGTVADLQTAAGKIFSQTADRSRPLWDATVVNGLQGGKTAVIWRVHHCLVDGIASVALIKALLDPSPKRSARSNGSRRRAPAPAPPRPLSEVLLTSVSEFTDGVLSIASAGLSFAEALSASGIGDSLQRWWNLAPDYISPLEGFPFNQQCAGPRKFFWSEIPLSEIANIRAAAGGTLNDVVLAILAAALRRYADEHGQAGLHRVRILVPFNTRRQENMAHMGVNISLVPVNLELSTTEPLRLMESVEATTRLLKQAHMARAISVLSACLSALPGPAKPFAGWLLSNPLPFLPWNFIATNVPGPAEPLYLLGRKMIACYPYLPLIPFGTRGGLTCAFYSYAGQLYCGFTGDVAAMPDLDRFCELFELSYAEFRAVCRPGAIPAEAPRSDRRRSVRTRRQTTAGPAHPRRVA